MATIRTGRASVHLLDNVRVDYYGTPTPVNQVANLHVPEPGMITITPWTHRRSRRSSKALRTADRRKPVERRKDDPHPDSAATEERRKELVKKPNGVAEEHRVAVRNSRRDSNDRQKAIEGQRRSTTTIAALTTRCRN